jgi:Flp pilus assembly protein TadG
MKQRCSVMVGQAPAIVARLGAARRTWQSRSGRAQAGQSLAEFSIVLPLFVILLMAIAAFGVAFEKKVAMDNAARSGARYAAVYPDKWSSATWAPSDTIEGMIQAEGSTLSLPNDGTSIQIAYLAPQSTGSAIECGYYSPSAGFVLTDTSAYPSEASCLIPFNLVQVTLSYSYKIPVPVLSAVFPSGITIQSSATMMEEQGPSSGS